MRRTRTIFLSTVVATLIGLTIASPAATHPMFDPIEGRVGTKATHALVVDSHFPGDRVTSVDITAPSTFTLDRIEAPAGWTTEARPGGARLSGDLPEGRTVSFRVTGTPRRKGIAVFDLVTASASGASMRWTGSCRDRDRPFKGAMLFVDLDIATACDPPADRPALQTLGLGLIAGAVVLGAAYPLVKRARERSAPR